MYIMFLAVIVIVFYISVMLVPFLLPYTLYLKKHEDRLITDDFNLITNFFKFYFRLLTLKRPLLK